MTIDCNMFTRICTIFTRIVIIGYAILAAFTLLEARDLATSDGYYYDSDKGIVSVPLLLCAPPSIENDGSTFIISSDSGCHSLTWLIGAPFICSACSIFACLFFVIMDILARYKKGPFSMSAVAGMGLYLIIILVQAGISTGALVEQSLYWVEYMQKYLDDNVEFHVTARSYANTNILLSSAGCAFVTAFFVLVDTILYRCNEKRQTAKKDEAIVDFVHQSTIDVEKVAHTSTIYDLNKSNTLDTMDENNRETCSNDGETATPTWVTSA